MTTVTVTPDTQTAHVIKPENPMLTAAHRCDGCGAQAWVQVFLRDSGSELLFCNHHYQKHETALQKVASEILDETDRLRVNRLKGSENS